MPSSIKVVILGPSNADELLLAEIGSLRLDASGAALILVTREVEVGILHGSMRAGVREVVRLEDIADQLSPIVDRCFETAVARQAERQPPATRRGHVIAVFGAKGGVGCTTVALNLAVALRERTGAETILVDADLQFGDVAMMTRLSSEGSIMDFWSTGKVTWPRVQHALITHEASGVQILPAPRDPQAADLIDAGALSSVVDAATELADFVVVDVPSGFNEFSLAVLEAADQIVLVTAADLANLKNAHVALGLLSKLGLLARTRALVNRVGLKAKLDLRDLESVLGCSIIDHCPNSDDVIQAETRRVPFVMSHHRSSAARAMFELADALASKAHPQLSTHAPGRR